MNININDWYNETSFNVPSELPHPDDFGEHPQFKGWSYGSDYSVIYVIYSDGTEKEYNYFCNSWTC
tara:strand:+ start:96775 stop:96972 length:198 start_codon:yes stop_codon:yes gene_type:complete